MRATHVAAKEHLSAFGSPYFTARPRYLPAKFTVSLVCCALSRKRGPIWAGSSLCAPALKGMLPTQRHAVTSLHGLKGASEEKKVTFRMFHYLSPFESTFISLNKIVFYHNSVFVIPQKILLKLK